MSNDGQIHNIIKDTFDDNFDISSYCIDFPIYISNNKIKLYLQFIGYIFKNIIEGDNTINSFELSWISILNNIKILNKIVSISFIKLFIVLKNTWLNWFNINNESIFKEFYICPSNYITFINILNNYFKNEHNIIINSLINYKINFYKINFYKKDTSIENDITINSYLDVYNKDLNFENNIEKTLNISNYVEIIKLRDSYFNNLIFNNLIIDCLKKKQFEIVTNINYNLDEIITDYYISLINKDNCLKTISDYLKLYKLLTDNFPKSTLNCFIDKCIKIFSAYKDYDNYLIQYINKQIQKNKKININLLNYIKENDVFISKYKVSLISRFLKNDDITNQDLSIYTKLKSIIAIDFSKIKILFDDKKKSKLLNQQIKIISNNYITNLTYGCNGIWPLNMSSKPIVKSFSKQKDIIEVYLNSKFENRNVYFNNNFISGIVNVNLNNTDFTIEASSYIIDILLRFNETNFIENKNIENHHLNPLIEENILYKKDNKIYLNLDFKSEEKHLKLKTINKKSIVKKTNLDIDRQSCVKCFITKFMKKNKSETFDMVFKKTKQNVAKMFKLEKLLYKTCIKNLIDLEIIKKTNDQLEYLP